jgi:hypothetical protein
MKKRGMLSEPFYYIFVIIVIALIFVFGYQQLSKLQNLNEKAKFITFKTDLKNAVNNIYYKNPGSIAIYSSTSENKPLTMPKDTKKICFKKLNNVALVNSDSQYFTSFEINNLIPEEGTNLKIDSGEYCANIKNSRFSFTLENKVVNKEIKVYIK